MTVSEIIRVVLAVGLVVFLWMRRSGVSEWRDAAKRKKEKGEEQQKRAEARKEARRQAIAAKEEKVRQTSQLLKLDLKGLHQKETVVAGAKLWYLEGGEMAKGGTVLLLHGFASQKEDWNAFAKHLLEADLHVVVPDLAGFGQNTKNPDADYQVTTQAKRIRALAKALEIEKCHMVGSSLGGTIAATLAYGAADLVHSLTLIEPLGVRVREESDMAQFLARGIHPLTIATPEAFDNLQSFLHVHPPALPEAQKRFRAEETAANRAFYLKMWPQIMGGERAYFLDRVLPEIKGKRSLVIQGEKSRVVHPSTAQAIASILEGSRAVVIPDCGHLPATESPDKTALHFLGFVSGF